MGQGDRAEPPGSTALLRRRIEEVFGPATCPASWALPGSYEGTESEQIAKRFAVLTHWRDARSDFLNAVFREESGHPLIQLSDEGFRHFLPAFLLADIDGQLEDPSGVSVAWHLTHYFTEGDRSRRVNERRFGAQTWEDVGRHRMSTFLPDEVSVIVAYLRWKATADPSEAVDIQQALDHYWTRR